MQTPEEPTQEDESTAPLGNLIGAVVTLKSGSPAMTVSSAESENCICVWFDQISNKFEQKQFSRESLVIVWHNQMPVEKMPNTLIQVMAEHEAQS